jgi:hypothetical protein
MCEHQTCWTSDPAAASNVDRLAPQVEGKFASAFVRARKPEAKSCCGPECRA